MFDFAEFFKIHEKCAHSPCWVIWKFFGNG